MSATTSSPIASQPEPAQGRRAAYRAWTLLCAAAVVLSLLPLPAIIARPGLDPSWVQGLHVAARQGLVFGRDIVFTYGPLGFAHMREYWPGLFGVTVAYWLVLAVVIADAWAQLARRAGVAGLAAWAIFALTCAFASTFAYDAFVVLFLVLWVVLVEADEPAWPRLAAHSGIAGLAALSKFPFAVASGLALAVVLAILLWRRQVLRAGLALGAWAVAFLAGWLAFSQPLGALPAYIANSLEIVDGYSEAMSRREGPRAEMHAYGALALAVMAALAWAVRARPGLPLLATSLFVLASLVLTWGQVFTRHDERGPSGFVFLLLASLVAALRLARFGRGPALLAQATALACVVALAVVIETRIGQGPARLAAEALMRPVSVVNELADLATGKADLAARHEAAMARIRGENPLPKLEGTVDVYSYDDAVLFAHSMRWSPRPIFHSYQANTAALAEMNRRHLLGASAPDHLLVRIQPIDGRLPASEDGASWLAMLERYALRSEEGFVILDRQPSPAPAVLEPLPSWRGSGWHELPAESMLFATLEVHEPERKLSQLFKRPTVFEIQLRMQSGLVHAFRFVRSVGEAPFLLSPLVRTNGEFARLFVPCEAGLRWPQVAAVRLLGAKGAEVPYTLELQAVRALPRSPASVGSRERALACKLRLVSGMDAVRSRPFVTDGDHRGINAHPPATFAFDRAVRRARVCTRIAREALANATDGYTISLGRSGAAQPTARLEVTPQRAADGAETCVEASFGRAVDDVELRVEGGGDERWDWVYITRVETDE